MDVQHERPIRLWVAVGLNILSGITGFVLLVIIFLSENARIVLDMLGSTLLFGLTADILLIGASILGLRGKKIDWQVMLGAAVLFYGAIIAQNVIILADLDPALLPSDGLLPKPVMNIVRNAIALGINCWALLSSKTQAYFDHVRTADYSGTAA